MEIAFGTRVQPQIVQKFKEKPESLSEEGGRPMKAEGRPQIIHFSLQSSEGLGSCVCTKKGCSLGTADWRKQGLGLAEERGSSGFFCTLLTFTCPEIAGLRVLAGLVARSPSCLRGRASTAHPSTGGQACATGPRALAPGGPPAELVPCRGGGKGGKHGW